MAIPLLTTKLYIPSPCPNLVPRPRLIQRLDEGLKLGHRLTLVSAPAGFGKTTLIAEWLEHLGSAPQPLRAAPQPLRAAPQPDDMGRYPLGGVGWLSLDEDDNDPIRFFTYLTTALESVQAGVGADARALLQSTQPPPLKSVLTTLVNDLASLGNDPVSLRLRSGQALRLRSGQALRLRSGQALRLRSGQALRLRSGQAGPSWVLVLDDYHFIEQQSIHDALTFLIEHLPPQLHLVIISRVDPPLPLARLRGRAQLTELRAADLRFTREEAAVFLTQVMDLRLTEEHLVALDSRTEGWIAGLQLAALSMQGRRPEHLAGFIAAFGGSHRHVIDYLVEEVMAQQPSEIHDFLCHTSILDQLSAPLCNAVTGREDSDAIMKHLERANLFLIPLDDRREWYRYHHLFTDFLRNHLHLDLPAQALTLHRRASGWYERNGFIAEAIDHALSAQDFERAAGLVEQAAEPTMKRSEVVTFLNWVEALPDEVVHARPLLCAYQGGMQLMSGRPPHVVEGHLQQAIKSDAAGSAAGAVAAFRAMMAAYRGDTRRGTELARQALELLPEENLFLRSVAAGILALNLFYSGDTVAATQALEEAARISLQAGNLMNAVLAICHLAEICVLQGQLYQARAFYDQALELAVDDQGRRQPIAGIALIGLGHVEREWNNLESARRHYIEGIGLAKKWSKAGAVNGYVGLAYLKQVQGDVPGAREAIQAARQLAKETEVIQLDDALVAAHQAYLWMLEGDLEAVMGWVKERGLEGELGERRREKEEGDGFFSVYPRYLEQTVLARLYLAQEQPQAALRVLEPLLQAAEKRGWVRLAIPTLLLQAIALQRQGSATQAMTVLERGLSAAEPGGHVCIFLDEGQPMEELLRQAASRGVALDYVGKLVAAFAAREPEGRSAEEQELPSAVAPPSPSASQLVDSLSERELEVLRLIGDGLSNREIAESLVIAVSTVKTHINNIYRKLDVSRRTQAVARARELNLF